jgi:TPR repeat protein
MTSATVDSTGRGAPRGGPQPASFSRVQRVPIALFAMTALLFAFVLLSRVGDNPKLVWAFGIASGATLGWTLVLWALAKQRNTYFQIDFAPPVKSHYVQACVQGSIYAYWGYYWREVYHEIPLIVAQLLFLYIVDALISWSRGRGWRLGFGVFPIIFSTNLFIWFRDDFFIFQFLMVATAAFGKEFVKWERDGRRTHIFNPSALALGLCSIVLIVTQTTHYTWGIEIASTLAFPPHIYLWIFLVGLVVQYFFAVTLMTLSATASLWLLDWIYTAATGTYHFVDSTIPIAVFLGLHLLVTDPSTSPRTNIGRVVFGALYGLGNFVLYWIFEDMGIPEYYDKLLPVLVLNLMVPLIDRWARSGPVGRFTRWESAFQPRKANLVHMAAWAALFFMMLARGQADAPHPGASIAFWREAYAEGKHNAGKKLLKVVGSQADQGSGPAANELAVIYMEGKIVEQNRAAAGHYFAVACQAGNADGCANLATQFLFLREAKSDKDVARALTRLERECGEATDGRACYLIGFAYESGRGRPRDEARARQLYASGCEQGNLDACKGLARTACSGSGGAIDLESAVAMLEASCAAGDAESCTFLAYAWLAKRDEAKARAWLEKACALGSAPACEALAQPALPPCSTLHSVERPPVWWTASLSQL